MITLPWNTLLPDPASPGERISYLTTTDPKANKPTRNIRLTRSRAELRDLLARATVAGCCRHALANLRDLLGVADAD